MNIYAFAARRHWRRYRGAAVARRPLLYVLQSGYLYGTERMALATAEGLSDTFEPVLFGPAGPALATAASMGFSVRPVGSNGQFVRALLPFLHRHRSLAFVATGVKHSATLEALNVVYRRRVAHVHVVHGGAPDRGTYGRKWVLNLLGVTVVAVSDYARARLIEYGVRPDKIRVIHNFLPAARVDIAPRRPPFDRDGVRNVVLIARFDYLKRVALLFDALDFGPELRRLHFTVVGEGPELGRLKERAARHPNVSFSGFLSDVAPALASADLLLHTCPVETFGLVVLEAMAADLPVLVPDQGGTDLLVEEGVSGFKFRSDDPSHLAARLLQLSRAPAAALNSVVAGGRDVVRRRYAPAAALAAYREVLGEYPAPAP